MDWLVRRLTLVNLRTIDLVKKLEQGVTLVLVVMLCIIVVLATVELAVTVGRDVLAPPVLFPGIDKLLDMFGRVLLVVIGLELIATIRALAAEGLVRVEVVLTVAIIALARRVLVLEPGHAPADALFATAALVAALSLAYWAFVIRRRGVS